MNNKYAKSNSLRLASDKNTSTKASRTLAQWLMLSIGLLFINSLVGQTALPSNAALQATHTSATNNWTQHVWLDAASYGVNVQWSIAQGEKLKFFVVERSIDGKLFSQIGKLSANSINEAGNAYSFPDSKLPPIELGRLYYRIKGIDQSGTTKASDIAEFVLNPKLILNITTYPNAEKALLQFEVVSPSENIQEMKIVDGLGREVWLGPNGSFDTVQHMKVDLQNWGKGIYFLRILTDKRTLIHRIVKDK